MADPPLFPLDALARLFATRPRVITAAQKRSPHACVMRARPSPAGQNR